MNRLLLCLLALVIGLGLFWSLRQDGADDGKQELETATATPAPQEKPSGLTPTPPREEPAPEPLREPVLDPLLAEQLAALRQTFLVERTSPARIRLQGALDRLWSDGPPVEVLLHEIHDEESPLACRLHFAHRLRNFAKVSAGETRARLAGSLRQIIASPKDSLEAKVTLAGTLMEFDDSEPTIRVVASLIDAGEDDALAAKTIASLALTKQTAAKEFLWDWTQTQLSDIDRRPLALATSLAPLARERDLPLDPLLVEVVSRSNDFTLLSTALQCAAIRPPSPDSVQAIVTAHQRASEFSPREEARIEEYCRHSLESLSPILRQDRSLLPKPLQNQIEDILHPQP